MEKSVRNDLRHRRVSGRGKGEVYKVVRRQAEVYVVALTKIQDSELEVT